MGDTVEGIFLHYYKKDTKLLVIQINRSSVESSTAWQDECKQVYDLNVLVMGDLGYFDAADPDDTLRNNKAELEITAIAWKGYLLRRSRAGQTDRAEGPCKPRWNRISVSQNSRSRNTVANHRHHNIPEPTSRDHARRWSIRVLHHREILNCLVPQSSLPRNTIAAKLGSI